MNIVFLGGGRITSALLAGLRLTGTRHRLIVHDRNAEKLRALKRRYAAIIESDLQNAVWCADLLVIAVRPASIARLLGEIGHVPRATLAVSLAAGVPSRTLDNLLGSPMRWARAMPSPVCRSGRGLTGVTFPRTLPKKDRERVRDFFAAVGPVVEIPERKFDAFTVTYSCSHGYHALAALADAAVEAGLDQKTALLAAAHALADGISAWREGKELLDELLEEAVTPGGIAAASAAAMNTAGYLRAVRKGVAAGLRHARRPIGPGFAGNG